MRRKARPSAWTQLFPPVSPEARAGTFVHDPKAHNNKPGLWLLGGMGDRGLSEVYRRDNWRFDGKLWHQHRSNPPSKTGVSYDAACWRDSWGVGYVFQFGGVPAHPGHPYPSGVGWTWNFSGNEFIWNISSLHNVDLRRHSHVIAWNPKRDRVVMVGGCNTTAGGPDNTVWEADRAAENWTMGPFAPFAREQGAMSWDGNRECLIFIGGKDEKGQLHKDVWLYDGVWRSGPPAPAGFRPRYGLSICWDEINKLVVVFGGSGSKFGEQPPGTFVIDSKGWHRCYTPKHPGGRHRPALGTLNGKVYLFGGGKALGRAMGDLWELDPTVWV